LNFLFVLALGLAAGAISGIVGTGSSIMLMPVSSRIPLSVAHVTYMPLPILPHPASIMRR
jgi:hypothetical protein